MADPRPLIRLPDADYPADPYPGARPGVSFVHLPDGYSVPLEHWPGPVEPGVRIPVLAYGSNACPSKITWLRTALGLTDPVIVLRCDTVGIRAVWCGNRRVRDDQYPAVLVAAPGVHERHAVWLATPSHLEVLDACEGIGVRYDRITLAPPVQIRSPDGAHLDGVQAYVAAGPIRAPMLVSGRMLPLATVDQSTARRWAGAASIGPWEFRC